MDRYEEWVEWEEGRCGRELVFPSAKSRGRVSDVYATVCDLDAGHDGRVHEGPDPYVEGRRVRWTGGGYVAGDYVDHRVIEWVAEPEGEADYGETG